MLETPQSAKTPSPFGIPNSCTAAALLENGDKTQLTFDPNLVKRSRAICSACSSRSRLINLPEESLSAMASECPPAPNVASTYIPSDFIRSHSSTSCNITGVCGAPLLTSPALSNICHPEDIRKNVRRISTVDSSATSHSPIKFPNLPKP